VAFAPLLWDGETDAAIYGIPQVDYFPHYATLSSVPRSLGGPITTNQSNINGFPNLLIAVRDAEVKRFVRAVGNSTFGEYSALPKVEDQIGKPLSSDVVNKRVNVKYTDVLARAYDFKTLGLRYYFLPKNHG
jgi:UDP-N-acetylglucosamine/UDP-N-acetylgalactosamine 4-epimerase